VPPYPGCPGKEAVKWVFVFWGPNSLPNANDIYVCRSDQEFEH